LEFALARYNFDGSLDSTFGSNGKVITAFFATIDNPRGTDSVAYSVAVQTDGKIVAAGVVHDPCVSANGSCGGTNVFALARYNADGTLDSTFGLGGRRTTNFDTVMSDPYLNSDIAYSVALQSDGKIVAAGAAARGPDYYQSFALARFNSDGNLDTTFGNGGKVTTDVLGDAGNFSVALSAAAQADGKIVVAGYSADATAPDSGRWKFILARYNANGGLDTSFGSAGKVITNFVFGSNAFGKAVAVQSDGRIVAAGTVSDPTDPVSGFPQSKFGLARFDGGLIPVTIDIKPGDFPNTINPKSGGQLPVAILSNATFHAPTMVDLASPTFGRTGTENSLAFCHRNGQDVNADGFLDLVCNFHIPLTGLQAGDVHGVLMGKTTAGAPLQGQDSVNILVKKK
jgi:uncharacterized delta-60 repeat protein